MANTRKAIRIDTHRALMLDESAADEGGREPAEPAENQRQGRGPVPKYTGPRNKPSKAARFVYSLVGAVLGAVLAWHLLMQIVSRLAA